mgnify:CR=1 FL=1
MFTENKYTSNYGSGSVGGVITIQGAHFFLIDGDIFENNGDSYEDIVLAHETRITKGTSTSLA